MKTVPKLNLNIPDHTILDKIGEGGMSAVYLGRQISLQRKVAIKVLKKLVMDDKSLAERFVDEAKTVASLDHPHIISIYEAKKLPSGLAYFTMPYLTHGDFGEIICTSSDHLIELLCQICDGLSHAHKYGIIHRDLKPENILFDQFGRIKIADFGIAISKHTKRKTKESQLLGSAHYMSPEQIQSKDIDRHSDIYSLGCIIYEKLTGDHVFHAGNDFSILMSHINKPIPQLPKPLADWQPIIDRCLAKKPADRFDNVDELKDALLAIKYSKANPQPINPETRNVNTKPYLLGGAAGVLGLLLLAWFMFGQEDAVTADEPTTQSVQTIQAPVKAEPIKPVSQEEPFEMTIGVVPNDDEQVDITGTLDNETINQMSIEVKLSEAEDLLKRLRLTKPQGDNAADKFHAVLLEQPDNTAAQQGLIAVGHAYMNLINSKIEDQDYDDAMVHVQSWRDYLDNYPVDAAVFENKVSAILSTTQQLVRAAVQKRRTNPQASQYLQLAQALKPNYAFVNDLQTDYDNIPQNGQLFSDKLNHQFVFFAMPDRSGLTDLLWGQHEVSIEQFKRFAQERFTDEKCHHYDKKSFFKKTWLKPPFPQSASHPVICINAAQAEAYAQWLSDQTGHTYRLPTAAEFTQMNRLLSANNNCQTSNLAGTEVKGEDKATEQTLGCDDGQVFTAATGHFSPLQNVYDLQGNVSEWVSNCGGQSHCAIGTSWRSGTGQNHRDIQPENPAENHSHIGFRLVREL